jgi:SAM-dependent methyltransferase
MPTNLRFDQAVVCEGAFYANPTIEHFALKPAHRILIYGASGAIGTAALQLAKDRGAEVTAVVAGRHLGLARSLGADLAIDYATDAFDKLGRSFDFVLDAVGKLGIRRWRRWLKPGGVFAATDRGPWSQNLLFLLWSKVTGSGRVVIPLAKRGIGQAFVNELKDRIEEGRFIPVIDRRYPLDAIADAYRYVQTGEKAGVVVIDIGATGLSAPPRILPLATTPIYRADVLDPAEIATLQFRFSDHDTALVNLRFSFEAGRDDLLNVQRQLEAVFPRWYARDWHNRAELDPTLTMGDAVPKSFEVSVRDYLEAELTNLPDDQSTALVELANSYMQSGNES